MTEHHELHSTPLGVVYETPGQDAISLWRVYGSNGQGTSSIPPICRLSVVAPSHNLADTGCARRRFRRVNDGTQGMVLFDR